MSCVVSCVVSGVPGLFEDGQEYQYSYLAFTLSGVRDPKPFASSFGVRGKVTVQRRADYAVVKISDAALGMHNGAIEMLHNGQVKFVKKPEMAILEKPFKILYKNGKAAGMDADAADPEWSVNIKKGLATALQAEVNSNSGKGENAYVKVTEVRPFPGLSCRFFLFHVDCHSFPKSKSV